MDFKKEYAKNNEDWRKNASSEKEFNAYIAYKYARDRGQSHEEAMAHAAREAQEDAKFNRLVRGKDLPQAGPSNK